MRSTDPRAALAAALAVGALVAGCGGDEGAGEADTDAELPSEELVVAAGGDIGMEKPGRATLAAMGDSDADLFLGLGDFSYAGPGSEQEFCDLVHAEVGEEAPFEIVSGNHEEDSGEDGRIAEYAGCLPDRLGASGEYGRQYYFDVGTLARFIMIAPDLTIEGKHYYYGPEDDGRDNPNMAWLQDAIDGAREAGVRWVVVGMHKNCISVGEYYCDVYQDLFDRLISEGVDVVLSGHDHSYQRSHQVVAGVPGCKRARVDHFDPDCVADDDSSMRQGNGTVFVIAGASGAELYELDADDPEAGYFAATMGAGTPGRRHGFALLDITPERLSLEFAGSTPGDFTDRFEIDAG